MATTTVSDIRNRIAYVVRTLVPSKLPGDRFEESDEELAGIFRDEAARENVRVRRFSVRDVGDVSTPLVSNNDVEWREVIFELLVAYPQSHRYGGMNAVARDAVLESDQTLIEGALGWRGASNFQGSFPNATWLSGSSGRERGEGVDLLVFRNVMGFYRSVA